MERVCAVVVTYNRKALLRQCLDALQRQTHPLAEIVVVDNASTDGTAEMLDTEFPSVETIRLSENCGGAGGFYAGMKVAAERVVDWIWVMDDDAEPAPDALEQLFVSEWHHREDTVALTALKILANGHPQYDQAGWYAPLHMEITPIGPSSDVVTEIAYSSFVGLLIRASAVDRVGLPASDFFIWYDDVEYCMRLARIGRLYLVRSSRIVHHATSTGTTGVGGEKPWRNRPLHYYWRYYYWHRNRMLIVRKHAASSAERVRGYFVGFYRVVRHAVSTVLYDKTGKSVRLCLLGRAFVHGLFGRSGKIVDPAYFASPDQRVGASDASGST